MNIKEELTDKDFWGRLALGTALLVGAGQLTFTPVAGATDTIISTDISQTPIKGGEGSGNNLTISGGNITANGIEQYIYGGYQSSSGDASNNTVTISGGAFAKHVYIIGGAGGTYCDNNTVTISGGTFAEYVTVRGGSGAVASNNNTVTIEGGTYNGAISIYGSSNGGTNNTVTIKNLTGEVGDLKTGGGSNNTINLLMNNLNIGMQFMGGGSGDTLNIAAKGITAKMLSGFQHINFYLPSGITSGDTMLTVEEAADLTGATIGAAALDGGWVNLNVNDTVTLLSANLGIYGINDGAIANSIGGNITFLSANNLAVDDKYTLTLSKANNKIIATVTDKSSTSGGGSSESGGGSSESGGSGSVADNDRVKSPVETRMASLGVLTSTADMLAGAGFDRASEAVQAAKEESKDVGQGGQNGIWMEKPEAANYFVPYAVTNGFSLRHQSGSHVDTKGFGLSIGFSREYTNKNGILLVAPFVEYSNGKYDSYQDNGIHADGKSSAYGLGVMARQTNHDGLYYEGSLRFGRVKSDYSSQLSTVTHADYDSSSNYWAAHLGLGKITALKGNNSLNCYLKYFYTHQTGDDVTININGGTLTDNMSFAAVDSHRIRMGARLTHKLNEKNSLYGGLAYQYEFGGDARATYNGQSAPSPSVKGSSGMLELGWQTKPGSNLTMDVSLTGWAGKQRGVTGQLGFNWKF